MKIKSIQANPILDSRNKRAIEIIVNKKYRASIGSGTSKGQYEVQNYPKNDPKPAIEFLNKFNKYSEWKIETFEDIEVAEQLEDDIGGNGVVALQFALLKALSENNVWSFLNPHAHFVPRLLGNCIGGGAHYKGKAPVFQEFLLSPKVNNITSAQFANQYIYNSIQRKFNIKEKTLENALVPNLKEEEILGLLKETRDKTEAELGFKIDLGLDVAATQFFRDGAYVYRDQKLYRGEQVSLINKLVKKYKIMYVEDPLRETDLDGFAMVEAELVCGDDLVCTNIERLEKARGKINCVIVKPNQIGSLIKTKALIDYAKANDIKTVMSHRSGETDEDILSDLAIAFKTDFVKFGIMGKERLAKIKRLEAIEKEMK